MDREIPQTDHDLLISLWTFLVGVNGGGLISKFDEFARSTDTRLDTLERKMPDVWTRKDHERAEAEYAERDKAKAIERREGAERRKLSRREVAMLIITLLGSLGTVAAVIVAIIALGGAV